MSPVPEDAPPPPVSVRFATWNTSLFDPVAGGLVARLERGDEAAKSIAALLQRQRPDVVLLNEFDYDAAQRAAELFQRRYLEVPQAGQAPIRYDYRYLAPVNTGEPSGLDLDNDGRTDGPNDAWGYGTHPGQYGMLVLSRFPIDALAVRSFRHFLWKDLPAVRRPRNPDGTPWHADATWAQLRLSSKSHWDVPIRTALGTVHFLVSHPTPPVFDGPEDRNGARNADEIALWNHYLSDPDAAWLCDDRGACGGLAADARFVLAGDLNADRDDGDGRREAIAALLDNPRVDAAFVPRSEGAGPAAAGYGFERRGDVSAHTGDFGPRSGTLRIDYLLPSKDFSILAGGVFWPLEGAPEAEWTRVTDHHMVWLDLADPTP
ncbi:MAG TPA: endonuclease/exonuclease/phosphatase family protein [Chiayiivirga sp.]|nr:endonuclease/exonuclease/phosphatase family protein [Chiayiivirga sp.]HRQ34833.1 endonuclease/exonuclease/phosphatase family protein [Chiayiivirga sp.]